MKLSLPRRGKRRATAMIPRPRPGTSGSIRRIIGISMLSTYGPTLAVGRIMASLRTERVRDARLGPRLLAAVLLDGERRPRVTLRRGSVQDGKAGTTRAPGPES